MSSLIIINQDHLVETLEHRVSKIIPNHSLETRCLYIIRFTKSEKNCSCNQKIKSCSITDCFYSTMKVNSKLHKIQKKKVVILQITYDILRVIFVWLKRKRTNNMLCCYILCFTSHQIFIFCLDGCFCNHPLKPRPGPISHRTRQV